MTECVRGHRIEELVRVIVELTHMKERQVALLRHDVDDEGVELAAYRALFELFHHGAMRSSELADRIFTDPSTASRYVTTLTTLGLVDRRPDPRDRRAALIDLTDSGRAKIDQIKARRTEFLTPLLDEWTDEELNTFVALGDKALAQFDRAMRLLKGTEE
jgi:DNA-binding MarR family transcriptional regulator